MGLGVEVEKLMILLRTQVSPWIEFDKFESNCCKCNLFETKVTLQLVNNNNNQLTFFFIFYLLPSHLSSSSLSSFHHLWNYHHDKIYSHSVFVSLFFIPLYSNVNSFWHAIDSYLVIFSFLFILSRFLLVLLLNCSVNCWLIGLQLDLYISFVSLAIVFHFRGICLFVNITLVL